ncbi:phosphatidate cytidylyltransferase [Endothiovibrio diazotrophicus]
MNLHPHIAVILAATVAVLLIATIAVRLLPLANRDELTRRVNSWWVIVALFGAALAGGTNATLWLLGLISFLALKEYLSLIPTRRSDRRVLFWAYLAIPAQYGWVAAGWYGMFIIFIPVYLFLFIALRKVLIGETESFLRSTATIQWGLMTTVFSLSHAGYLLALPEEVSPAGGTGLLLFLILLTELNDVAQYVWGKRFGRHPAAPRVSPNKTVEGLLGGAFTTTLAAWFIAPWLTPLTGYQTVAAGVLIAIFGFAGDLTLSAVKRDLGIKDSGHLLPGHGGVLDRVDSLTFTAPLFFHFLYYLHY